MATSNTPTPGTGLFFFFLAQPRLPITRHFVSETVAMIALWCSPFLDTSLTGDESTDTATQTQTTSGPETQLFRKKHLNKEIGEHLSVC